MILLYVILHLGKDESFQGRVFVTKLFRSKCDQVTDTRTVVSFDLVAIKIGPKRIWKHDNQPYQMKVRARRGDKYWLRYEFISKTPLFYHFNTSYRVDENQIATTFATDVVQQLLNGQVIQQYTRYTSGEFYRLVPCRREATSVQR